ncbi:hypothetical protein CE91St42_23130 [Oscillospiraceae bacterium]|nr:hypothetical protein CE91St42_23130 [Oscillospiraceae bacterium]
MQKVLDEPNRNGRIENDAWELEQFLGLSFVPVSVHCHSISIPRRTLDMWIDLASP